MYNSRLLMVALCIGSIVTSASAAHTYALSDHWTAGEDWTGNGVVAKDSDSYGTSDVWRYESVAPGDYDPANRSLLTVFAQSRWSHGDPADGNWTGMWCYVGASGSMCPDHNPSLDSVRTWVSPINGKVRIEGTMSITCGTDTNRDGVIGYIHLDDTQLWTADLKPNTAENTADFLIENVVVSVGDKIAFRVNCRNYRWFDGTTFNPTITYTDVPEPITVSLLSVGGLLLLRRRRD